jgi:hypothetical protein
MARHHIKFSVTIFKGNLNRPLAGDRGTLPCHGRSTITIAGQDSEFTVLRKETFSDYAMPGSNLHDPAMEVATRGKETAPDLPGPVPSSVIQPEFGLAFHLPGGYRLPSRKLPVLEFILLL